MYASETTDTVTIPAKAGPVVVTVQKLNWKSLKKAAQIRYDESIAQSTRIAAMRSGPTLLAAMAARAVDRQDVPKEGAEVPPPTPAELEKAREARYRLYDQQTVLEDGIQASTDGKPIAKLIADLEEASADRLHRAILDLTLPPIEPGAQETARKND